MEILVLLTSYWVTEKALEQHEKRLKIAVKIGGQTIERRACGSLVYAYRSLDDYGKAIEYHEKHSKVAKEIGDGAGE